MSDGPTAPGTPDQSGVPFDPSIHSKTADGKGLLNRFRQWFPKGGRGKAKAPVNPPLKPVSKAVPKAVKAPAATSSTGLPMGVDPFTEIAATYEGEKVDPAKVLSQTKETPAGVAETGVEPAPAGVDLGGDPFAEGAEGAPGNPSLPSPEVRKAKHVVQLIESASAMILGPDMKHTKEERAERIAEWVLYYETEGAGEPLSPWIGLVAGYGMMLAERADRPTFKARCAAIWSKMTGGK